MFIYLFMFKLLYMSLLHNSVILSIYLSSLVLNKDIIFNPSNVIQSYIINSNKNRNQMLIYVFYSKRLFTCT